MATNINSSVNVLNHARRANGFKMKGIVYAHEFDLHRIKLRNGLNQL